MSDSLVMLVCSVLASLAAGVLAAYGVCLGFFAMFKMRARNVPVKEPVRVQNAPGVVQG